MQQKMIYEMNIVERNRG